VHDIQNLEKVVNTLLDSYSEVNRKLKKTGDQLRLFQYIYKHSEDLHYELLERDSNISRLAWS